MYKSALTFGFLLSSLIMLAVMPILNQQQNNFLPIAMAQGYDNYDSYGDSSYSKYPTEENKYECRTGPFEGFFVSSVEFCKFKFDKDDRDRDNNITGTQGPAGPQGPPGPAGGQPGPQGPAGPPGPIGATGMQGERGLTGTTGMTGPAGEDGTDGAQGLRGFNGTDGAQGLRGFNGTDGVNGTQGPPGPNQINSTNLYFREGNSATTGNSIATITSTATCDSGDTVLHGNYNVNNFGGGPIHNLISSTSSTFDTYSTTVRAQGVTIQSTALCFNNS